MLAIAVNRASAYRPDFLALTADNRTVGIWGSKIERYASAEGQLLPEANAESWDEGWLTVIIVNAGSG
mgnify:CR=1 FL=1